MEKEKKIRLDPTNAVIVSEESGKIIHNGIHQRCPWCGTALLHNRHTYPILNVGAVGRWECGKCRKQYCVLTIPVPPTESPEEFYEEIRKRLFEENSAVDPQPDNH